MLSKRTPFSLFKSLVIQTLPVPSSCLSPIGVPELSLPPAPARVMLAEKAGSRNTVLRPDLVVVCARKTPASDWSFCGRLLGVGAVSNFRWTPAPDLFTWTSLIIRCNINMMRGSRKEISRGEWWRLMMGRVAFEVALLYE